MGESNDGTEPTGADANEWESLADWVGETTELAQEGAQLAARIQADWEDLSRKDTPWTTDTVMNEVVNSWEHWTPFVGDAIEQSIKLGSWWIQNWWPTAAADMSTWQATADESGIGDSVSKYIEVAERAVGRMLDDDYDSADAVDDMAVTFGMASQQAWRQAADSRATGNEPPDVEQGEQRQAPPEDPSTA